MKKLTTWVVLAMLCLNFRATAQEDLTERGLQPGDPVPSSAGLSAYQGKIVILDFWATWCAPCRKMVPLMDSLQTAFSGKVQFVSITYESQKVAAPVLAKLRKRSASGVVEIYADQLLRNMFPHRTLPHYVWIGPDGKVKVFSEFTDITAVNIARALKGEFPLAEKRDIATAYDPNRLLMIGGAAGDRRPIYHSLLTGYLPGVQAGSTITAFDTLKGQTFNIRNTALHWLLRLAYSDRGRFFTRSRVRYETRDSSHFWTELSGGPYLDWLKKGNGYCYELYLPPDLARFAFRFMQQDLARLFPQYTITAEKREEKCLVLVATGDTGQILSKGGELIFKDSPFGIRLQNVSLNAFIRKLERGWWQLSKLPILNGTGIKGKVDLDLKATMTKVEDVNKALAPYGLQFVEKPAITEFLVVRDSEPTAFTPKP